MGDFPAEEEVFINLHVGKQVQFLVDEGDAQLFGHGHGGLNQRLAQEGDAALVQRKHAGEDIHQRGFPGAVFPQNGVNFTLIDGEGNVIQHGNAVKGFADTLHFEYVHGLSISGKEVVGRGKSCPGKTQAAASAATA